MDRNLGISLEAKFHTPRPNLEYRDFEHMLEAVGASNDHGLPAFP
jgi:hypothetical protein